MILTESNKKKMLMEAVLDYGDAMLNLGWCEEKLESEERKALSYIAFSKELRIREIINYPIREHYPRDWAKIMKNIDVKIAKTASELQRLLDKKRRLM